MPLPYLSRQAEIALEVSAATRPLTALENFFANEIAYAAWELERVRANQSHTAAESRLHALHARASRNWNRAAKELAALQSARVNHATRLSPERQQTAAATPLADPARVPVPKLAGPVLNHAIELIGKGAIPSESLRIVREQEAR